MVEENWIIVGISGVTCAGKTTLATELNKIIPESVIISQDDYFLDVADPRHTWIPEINHINFDILSSLDMEKMHSDIIKLTATNKCNVTIEKTHFNIQASQNELQKLLVNKIKTNQCKLLILEGFCIFNYKPIESLCHIKYYFTLNENECLRRRTGRVYEPPDCPGYFQICVWPEYLKQLEDIQKNASNIKFHNEFTKEPLKCILIDLLRHI